MKTSLFLNGWGTDNIQSSAMGWLRFKNTILYVYGLSKVWYIAIVVMIAERIHLFPYRTQKLSFLTPKVLVGSLTGRIGNCHFLIYPFQGFPVADFFCVVESLRAPSKTSPCGWYLFVRLWIRYGLHLKASPCGWYLFVRLWNRYRLFYLKASPCGWIVIRPIVESLRAILPQNPLCALPRMRASFPPHDFAQEGTF